MNLHQFRFVQEAVRRNLNLTEAAKALHTSQPGVSKAIIELEEELGIEIFARHGKRIKRITEPGVQVLKSIEVILREVNNLKRIGEQYAAQDSGTLSIASTVALRAASRSIAAGFCAGHRKLTSVPPSRNSANSSTPACSAGPRTLSTMSDCDQRLAASGNTSTPTAR